MASIQQRRVRRRLAEIALRVEGPEAVVVAAPLVLEGLSAAQQQGARYANQIIDAMHASACRVSTKSDPNGSFGPAVECRSCEESVGLDEPDDVIKRFIADHRDCTGVAGFNESASANATYFDRLKVCRSLLTELADALDKHSAKQKTGQENWGYASELGHVEELLRDVLAFTRGSYNR